MSKVFVIYDSMTKEYSEPQTHESLEAMQQFCSVLVNTCTDMPQHLQPEDYAIFEIGEYDMFNGVLIPYTEKQFITSLGGLKRPCSVCAKKSESIDGEV